MEHTHFAGLDEENMSGNKTAEVENINTVLNSNL